MMRAVGVFLVVSVFLVTTEAGLVDLSASNAKNVEVLAADYKVLIVGLFHDMCPFSRRLWPVFNETVTRWDLDNPKSKLSWAFDRSGLIAKNYSLQASPSALIFVNGFLAKKEYKLPDTIEKFVFYAQQQLNSSIQDFFWVRALDDIIDTSKRNVIGVIKDRKSPGLAGWREAAALFRDHCVFYQGDDRTNPTDSLLFFEGGRQYKFFGDVNNASDVKDWLSERCAAPVRELTYDNVVEYRREGKPFLVYFYDPLTASIYDIENFKKQAVSELRTRRAEINVFVASFMEFGYVVQPTLGKTSHDMPILVYDNFHHTLFFPDMTKLYDKEQIWRFTWNPYESLTTAGSPKDAAPSIFFDFQRKDTKNLCYGI